MKFFKQCVLALAWVSCPVFANTPDINLPIWHVLRVVVDHDAELTPEQAWQRSVQSDALRLTQAHQVLAPANSAPHWAAWSVPEEYMQQLPLWLSLQSPTQDRAEVWMRFNGGPWQHQAPLHETTSLGWGSGQLFFTWPIYDTTYRQMDVLMRIQGLNRVQFPVIMQKPQVFMQQHLKLCLLISAILAAPLLLVIYSLTFLPVLKSNTLLLFNALAVLELVAGFWISGLMHLIWPALSRQDAAFIGTTAYGVLFGVSIYHAQAFMKTSADHPRLHACMHVLANVWWVVIVGCVWQWSQHIRFVLLMGGSIYALLLLAVSIWFYRLQPCLNRSVFVAVWVVYLLGMLVYWLFRHLEWPLVTTLGTHFIQGALVVTLLGWSACMHVLQDRDALRLDMQLSKERSRWFAAAHHDLWQPIQSLLLYARALVMAPEARRQGLFLGIQLASRSVDDFMDHLRFWADGVNDVQQGLEQTSTLCVNELLQPLVEEMRLLAEQKHILLRYQPSRCIVSVDVLQVGRMVRNLLTNALRYTQAGGSVLIGCRREGRLLWIWCMDTGLGMSASQLSDCFEAFTRFDKGTQQLRTLGLGLYSFKELAKKMGLKTRWHSSLGKGTMIGFAVAMA
jgi:signal transduction histidine kinase